MLNKLAILAALAVAPDQEMGAARPSRTEVAPDRPVAATYNGFEGQTNVVAPRMTDPGIDVDGRLDDPAWSEAALLTGFSQYDPSEGIPGTQNTEVLLLISQDAIYFGVRAFDDNPGRVRATLGERDTFYRTDDYIQFILDTFDDQRQAYSIVVNPLGVQQDGLWIEGRVGRFGRNFGPPIDWNPDFVWDFRGAGRGLGVRGRGQDPVQEHPLPRGRRTGVGTSGLPQDPAAGIRRVVGAGYQGRGEQADPFGFAKRAARPRTRDVPGAEPGAHRDAPGDL